MISQYEKKLNAVIKDLAYKKRCWIGYFEILTASSESVSIRYSRCRYDILSALQKLYFCLTKLSLKKIGINIILM